MTKRSWILNAAIFLLSTTVQLCFGCHNESHEESACWYTLWYIWLALGLFIVVVGILLTLYIKHRAKERLRARRRRRSTRTMPIHIIPTPPGYSEPSHKPPSYDDVIRHSIAYNNTLQMPGIIPYYDNDYGYQPPPTSMRMASTIPNIPHTEPPAYQEYTQDQGHGHPVSI